jgi:hypothetical protein
MEPRSKERLVNCQRETGVKDMIGLDLMAKIQDKGLQLYEKSSGKSAEEVNDILEAVLMDRAGSMLNPLLHPGRK